MVPEHQIRVPTMTALAGSKRKLNRPEHVSVRSKRTKMIADNESDDGSQYASGSDDSAEDHLQLSTSGTSTQPSTPGSSTPRSRPREKKFICEFPGCGKGYTRPVRLAEHQRSHTNERPFVCTHDDCDKSFLRESHLKHHIKAKHEDVRDYACHHPGCGKAFHTGTRLKEHKKIHDRVKEEFRCSGFPPCDQEFRKQDTLDRHIQLVHLNEKPFVCDRLVDDSGTVCGARFKTSTHLIGHKDREHSGNRFWCKICSPEMAELDPRLNPAVFETAVGFPNYAEMQQHIKMAHPPTCDQCSHVCASNRDLKAHMDIQHGSLDERKAFVCLYPGCGRGFTRKGNLDVHKRNVHAKEKQFICGQFEIKSCQRVPEWDGRGACGRGFGTKASLEEHVRTQHLHLPRSVRKPKSVKAESNASFDMEDAPPPQNNALAMLTGVGYEHMGRNIVCPEPNCGHRLLRYYHLELHLRSTHNYSGTEAIETVKELEALSGGDFWYGGDEDQDTDMADVELAQRLQALDPAADAIMQAPWMMNRSEPGY